jgi:RecA/RadA recombinase
MTDVLKKLVNQSLKKNAHLFQDVTKAGVLQKIPCDSPQMNYMLGGGITIGRIHRLRGPESSGKSTICNYLAGQLQKKLSSSGLYGTNPDQKMVVYVDWEKTFDMIHATENGLICDPDHFLYMTPDSIEDFSDEIIPMIRTGEIAAIIFDSDAASTTKAMWVDGSGKACVSPNTMVEYTMVKNIKEELNIKGTLENLFENVELNYKEMTPNVFYPPKRKVSIKTPEGMRPVYNCVYKGESDKDNSFKIASKSGVFLATGEHQIWSSDIEDFIRVKTASGEVIKSLNQQGLNEDVLIEKTNETFPILDLEVEGGVYFTGGILSHNTFGGQAKALGECIRKLNATASNFKTTTFWISQERVNMCLSKNSIIEWDYVN